MIDQTINDWLVQAISDELEIPKESISLDEPFEDLKLDSLSILTIAFDLEEKFNIEELSPTVFSEFNTINKLSEWLMNQK
jgi:acyl carrier protein